MLLSTDRSDSVSTPYHALLLYKQDPQPVSRSWWMSRIFHNFNMINYWSYSTPWTFSGCLLVWNPLRQRSLYQRNPTRFQLEENIWDQGLGIPCNIWTLRLWDLHKPTLSLRLWHGTGEAGHKFRRLLTHKAGSSLHGSSSHHQHLFLPKMKDRGFFTIQYNVNIRILCKLRISSLLQFPIIQNKCYRNMVVRGKPWACDWAWIIAIGYFQKLYNIKGVGPKVIVPHRSIYRLTHKECYPYAILIILIKIHLFV